MFDHDLRRYGQPAGYDEFSGFARDIQDLPLLSEPGTKWQYGVSLFHSMVRVYDWTRLARLDGNSA